MAPRRSFCLSRPDARPDRLSESDFGASRSPAETPQDFGYDALHRLVRETPRAGIAGVPNALGYDAAGNRKSTSLGQALVEEDPGASVVYGGTWSTDADNRATASAHRRAETNGSWVEFRFSGDAAALTYAALPDGVGGTLRATLNPGTPDEQALGVLDQCSASEAWQMVKTWTGLGDGAHVLRLTREEASCGSSASARADVDAFRGYSRQRRYGYDRHSRLEKVARRHQYALRM